MNDRQLECFMTIVREDGIANAAKVLYVSTSSLSQMIKKMEAELGVKLFTHNGRRLSLTYAGRQLYNFSKNLARDYKQLLNEFSDMDGICYGELILCLSARRASSLMPVLLPPYMQRFPDVKLNVVADVATKVEREQHLLGGNCDFIIDHFAENYYNREIERIELGTEQMMLILGKETDLAQRLVVNGQPPDSVAFQDIADEPLLLLPNNSGRRKMVEQMFDHIGKAPKVLAQVSPISISKDMVETGHFCTLSAEVCIDGQPLVSKNRNYYMVPIALEGSIRKLASRHIYIAYKKAIPLVTFQKEFINMALDLFSGNP